MEPGAPCNLYVKIGPPKPTPPPAPPAPVDDWTDPFYPEEEADQLAAADIPNVLNVRMNMLASHAPACCVRKAASSEHATIRIVISR